MRRYVRGASNVGFCGPSTARGQEVTDGHGRTSSTHEHTTANDSGVVESAHTGRATTCQARCCLARFSRPGEHWDMVVPDQDCRLVSAADYSGMNSLAWRSDAVFWAADGQCAPIGVTLMPSADIELPTTRSIDFTAGAYATAIIASGAGKMPQTSPAMYSVDISVRYSQGNDVRRRTYEAAIRPIILEEC